MVDEAKSRWIEVGKWASAIVAAFGLAITLHSDVRNDIASNATCCEECRTYRVGHDRMDELQQRQIDYTISRVDALSTVPTTRPDPFTGTEGRELERRLDEVERRFAKLEATP